MVDVKDTPGGRVKLGLNTRLVPRPHQIKVRVARVAPLMCLCTVELRGERERPMSGIQLCHSFPRSKSINDGLMTSVEYNWGMERESLSLDSRWNCFFAGNDLHTMYDDGLWCLLPSLKTLQAYVEAMEKDDHEYGFYLRDVMELDDIPIEEAGPKYHVYTLLAFSPRMKQRHISFYNTCRSDNDPFVYPFDDPIIRVNSHLHPKFVILSLGEHLDHCDRIPEALRQQAHVQQYSEELRLVGVLYERWTTRLTPEQEGDPDFLKFIPEVNIRVSRSALHDLQSYMPSGSRAKDTEEGATVRRRRSQRNLTKKPRSPSLGRVATLESVVAGAADINENNNHVEENMSDSEGEDDAVWDSDEDKKVHEDDKAACSESRSKRCAERSPSPDREVFPQVQESPSVRPKCSKKPRTD